MEIEVYQTVMEKDGTISAYIRFSDTVTGKILKQTCIQGKTQAEFEAKILEIKSGIESEQTKKAADVSMVSAAISKIKAIKEL